MSTLAALATLASPGLPGFIRLAATPAELDTQLGPLAGLVGTWVGSKGWNLIAVPNGPKGFQLLIRPIVETITFTPIGALVPNRGGAGGLMQIPGLHYALTVSDAETNVPLHIENGMWLLLNTPDGSSPPQVARLFSVPHGNVGLAQGGFTTLSGPPPISDNSALPDTGPNTPLGYKDPYLVPSGPFNATNPNAVLQEQLKGQTVLSTTTLSVDTANNGGGIVNIPFITQHADCRALSSVFWIETVDNGQGGSFMQLQYSQQVDLFFLPKFGAPGLIKWPHITVNTLVKQ